MNSLISIIIPTFNRKEEINHAIKSVINQTYENWELIIVDNNSTDGTDALIKGYENNKISLHKINNNGVIAASRNKGISLAKGDYVAFLDSDDWWLPNKLQECIKYIDNGSNQADFIYHSLFISHERKNKKTFRKIYARQLLVPIFEDLIMNNNPIATSSVIVSKKLISKAGFFDENPSLIAAEDYECWLKISKLTDKFISIRKPLGYWFLGENTSSPKLTLKYLDLLKKMHIDSFVINSKRKMPSWWNYSKGRALFLSNDLNNAKEYLQRALFSKSSLIVKIKCIYMLIKILFWK